VSESEASQLFERFLSKEKYERRISSLIAEGGHSLIVDFPDLYLFDTELAGRLLESYKLLADFESVTLSKVRIRDPDFEPSLHVRLRDLPNEVPIRKIGSEHAWRFIQVSGIVTKKSEIELKAVKVALTCDVCRETFITPLACSPPRRCPLCKNPSTFTINPEKTKMVDTQRITIQEDIRHLLPGEIPQKIEVELQDDLVNAINPGDKIRATIWAHFTPKKQGSPYLIPDFQANYVETIAKEKEILELTEDDLREIEKLRRDPFFFRKIVHSICPALHGLEEVKTAITLQHFEGMEKERGGTKLRGRIHILLIGDPATGKTQLLQHAVLISPRGIFTGARTATGPGLTATAVRERGGAYALEAGVLVLADTGVAAIDEFEKMREEDRESIHIAMEQQIIPIAKGGIVTTLNARTSILAAANPAMGRYNPYQTVAENITLPVTILSRFDLIFLLKDIPEKERDERMAEHILHMHDRTTPFAPPIEAKMLRKLILYGRQLKPVIPPEVKNHLKEFYLKMRAKTSDEKQTPISITPRQLESLIRLTEASAKAHLREEAIMEDAEIAINLMMASLQQVGLDPETGAIDIDAILTGKTLSLREKLQKVYETIRRMHRSRGEAIPTRDLMEELKAINIKEREAYRLLEVLVRDGRIFSPRPNLWRPTN